MADIADMKPGARFRHYKNKDYEIIAMATDEATEEPVVVYCALYGNNSIWVRRITSFCEVVDVNGQKLERFKLLA